MNTNLKLAGRFAILLSAALLAPVPSTSGQSRTDTADQNDVGADSTLERHPIDTSIKIYPTPIWSRTSGFSAGVGYEIDNLLMPRGRLLVTAKPGQHLGRYTATYFAKDAYNDPVYGLANVYYETTGRHWYYGLGPASASRNKVAVEAKMLEAELRVGFQPVNRRLLIQPLVRYIRHESVGFEEWDEGAISRLDPESLENLELTAGSSSSDRIQKGFAFGLVGGIDLLDRALRPRRGLLLQASTQRFQFDVPDGLEYDQHGFYAYGFLPVRRGVVALRAVTILTNQRGTTPIPFYFLPSLHGRMLPGYSWDRFVAPDLFVLTAEYMHPLFNVYNIIGLDALLSVGAGNVYDDLFDQFKADLTFEDDPSPGQASYPLRPSVAAGFDLYRANRSGFDFRVLVGLGTEGIRLVRFGFVHDLRDIELSRR